MTLPDTPKQKTKKNPSNKKIIWGVFLFLFVLLAYGLANTKKSVNTYFSFQGNQNEEKSYFKGSDEIALIRLEGVIFGSDEKFQKIQKALSEIQESESLKGLVLRINSPGGSVAPTQEVFEKLLEIREKMPVYCSIGEVAASGGYYIASACSEIYASKGSTTGSIGVIMQLMNMKELFEWAKLKPKVLKAGKFKDIASPYKEMPAEEEALLQELLDEIHQDFKKDIGQARGEKLSSENLEKYADGRIFTGKQAHQWGFVDQIGSLDKVIDDISQKLEIDGKAKIKELPEKKSKWSQYFENKLTREGLLSKVLWGHSERPPYQAGIPYFLPEYHFF